MIFSSLSIVMLVKNALNVSFVSSLLLVLEYYEAVLAALFGWLEPPLFVALKAFAKWLGTIEVGLSKVWRYCFVLLLVPITATIRVASLRGDSLTSIAVKALIGTAFALVISAVFGAFLWAVEYDNAQARLIERGAPVPLPRTGGFVALFVVLAPAVVLAAADFFMFARWSHPFRSICRVISNFALLLVTLVSVLMTANAKATGSPMATISIAMLSLIAAYSAFLIVSPLVPLTAVPGSEKGAAIGWNVFATFAATVVFLVTNSGLKLAGL